MKECLDRSLHLDGRCTHLRDAVADDHIMIEYAPRLRTYGILMLQFGTSAFEQGYRQGPGNSPDGRGIHYCPWCGKILPGEVRDEWYEVLEGELGLESEEFWFANREKLETLPPEMMTDEWWVKRKIGPTNHRHGQIAPHLLENPERLDEWKNEPRYITEPGWEKVPPGYRQYPCELPHRCLVDYNTLYEEELMYSYLPHVREYGVRVVDPLLPIDHQPKKIKPFIYCHACGDKLPESLRDEWEKRVIAAGFGVDAMDVLYDQPEGFPEHLKSDDWWRAEAL